MLDCTILTSPADLETVAPEWRELQKRAGHTPFTSYEWFRTWWDTLGNTRGRSLHIIIGKRHGKLVALLPLVIVRWKGFRILQFIGAEAFYLCDMLSEDASDAGTLWHTARLSGNYDFAHIRDVLPDSIAEQALDSFAQLQDRNKLLALQLPWNTAEEWRATLSKQFRRNLDKALRLLKEKGPVTYELCQSPPVPHGIIEDMVRHKARWCREQGLEGMFDQPNILSYYTRMAQEAAQQKNLVLAWLKCGEAIIAYHFMYRHGQTIYSYVLGIDPAWLKYSPGHLAHAHAIAWAIENDVAEFNHMQGDFAYKYNFSNVRREPKEYTFHRSLSLRGWLGEVLFIKRRALRRFLSKKRPGRTSPALAP